MFEYINTKTGARISSPDVLYGENWQVVGEEVEEVENTKEKTKKEKVQEEKSSDEITKKDIMAQLDALGIEYNPKARKDELYKLMMGE
ncbi:hypothetical protein [Anaerococcus obesiensis]|mgnify:CR=1 FL=1|uniref:hypothetical protein n=1 Tax=Anaerococcus obesiensis TaxID=1287640 RepID=UPI0002EDC499|nr:hypothetical protein [Anaerococcus obesiensis]